MLEIFSGNFFVEIFSMRASQNFFSPKIRHQYFFCLKGARSSPISLGSLSRLKLSQICEDFYSENLGSEDLISKRVFYYALIGHLGIFLV